MRAKFFNIEPGDPTVTIPVTVVDGKIAYFYEGPLPKLREGAIGDLILPQSAVLSPEWIAPLREEWQVKLLDKGADLMLAMIIAKIEPGLINETIYLDGRALGNIHRSTRYRFVPAVLKEPLHLLLRGTKKGILEGGACDLPSMGMEATSVNHAYSLASSWFEPTRMSHTGNVFRMVYYPDDVNKQWRQLDDLRSTHEAKYEEDRLLSERQLAEKRAREKARADALLKLKKDNPALEL